MHGYRVPLRIDEVPVPEPGPDEILLKVAATGMCRSDYQLLDGYFKGPFPVELPCIPGHEVTGRVAGLGSGVPKKAGYSEGDMVVVHPSWGDGTCRQCREGNEQLCSGNGRWVGAIPGGRPLADQAGGGPDDLQRGGAASPCAGSAAPLAPTVRHAAVRLTDAGVLLSHVTELVVLSSLIARPRVSEGSAIRSRAPLTLLRRHPRHTALLPTRPCPV
ncbi:alcohol dehydrogenase catalytic domain-containing protein [Streptomyces sp. NPDC052036]|uniref:alcohol dehydrogenase catalytic domain-containing protein n=1 Tax=unclassified Streptomyces TaxID=2593676 RepID=UPI00341F7653